MKRTVSSGASWKVTMTMIVRTSCLQWRSLRLFDEGKKERLASGNGASFAPPETKCTLMPIRKILRCNNKAAECSSVFHVSSREAIVQRPCVEYDVGINLQVNLFNWVERALIESTVIRLNLEAAAAGVKLTSAERTTLSSERCSFSLEVRMELVTIEHCWSTFLETIQVENL